MVGVIGLVRSLSSASNASISFLCSATKCRRKLESARARTDFSASSRATCSLPTVAHRPVAPAPVQPTGVAASRYAPPRSRCRDMRDVILHPIVHQRLNDRGFRNLYLTLNRNSHSHHSIPQKDPLRRHRLPDPRYPHP